MKERDFFVDFLKGSSIFLMVVGHSCPPSCLKLFIYLFHVSVFYFASGWLFNLEYVGKPLKFIKRKIMGLYVPYVKWGLLFFCIVNFLPMEGNVGFEKNLANIFDILMFHKVNILISPLWFLKSLFISELLFFMSFYFFRTRPFLQFSFLILVYTAGWFCSYNNIKLPFGTEREFVTTLILFLGYYMKIHISRIRILFQNKCIVAIAFIGSILVLFYGVFRDIQIDTVSEKFGYWGGVSIFFLVGSYVSG